MTLREDCQRCGNGTWAWHIDAVRVDVGGTYKRDWMLCEECCSELVGMLKKFTGEPTKPAAKEDA